MTTYYVDRANPNASDSAPGTEDAPLRTLTQANNLAVTGDTVVVRPATYPELITAKASGVTWKGLPGAIIDGQNANAYGIHLYGLTDCEVSGFRFTRCFTSGVQITGGGGHRILYNDCPSNGSGIKVQPIAPQQFNPSAQTGGSLTAGTYSYAITAIIDGAETLPSFTLNATVVAGGKVVLSWNKIAAASSFNIYGRTAGSVTKIANVANSFGTGFPTWTDDGTVTPSGVALPTTTTVNIIPCRIEGNDVSFSISHGIYLYSAIGCFVRGNRSHHNQFHGIALLSGANGNTVEFNRCYNNLKPGTRIAAGIQCDNFGTGTPGSSNNLIQYNACFKNDDTGVVLYNGSDNNIVRRNVCYDNGDHGIDNFSASGSQILNNTCVRNVTAGINAEGPSSNVVMKNNACVDNGVNSPRTSGNYRMDPQVIPTGVMDYNLSFLTIPVVDQPVVAGISNAAFVWGNTLYPTLAAFRAAVPSQMVHGVLANPVVGGMFEPFPPGSPARGIADTSASGYIGYGFTGLPDDQATAGAFH